MQDPFRPPDIAILDLKRYAILTKINEFFEYKPHFDLMFQIIARDPKDTTTEAPSLRQLYRRIRQQLPVDQFDLYENAIAANSKQLFDTFCRQNNPEGVVAFEKHGKRILTSIAQLNLFRIIISHGILGGGSRAEGESKRERGPIYSSTPATVKGGPNGAPSSNSKQKIALVHTKTVVHV